MSRNRGIHKPHAPREPMPFTTQVVQKALVDLSGPPAENPVTADEIARVIRMAHPRRGGDTRVTHNDLIRVRRELQALVRADLATQCAERPNDTGRRPNQFMARIPEST